MSALPGNLADLATPTHQSLTQFMHGCAPDLATRTMATTTLVLSLLQVAGRSASPRLPSLLLINAGEAEIDPLDTLANYHVTGINDKATPKQGTGLNTGTSVKNAPELMNRAVKASEHLRKSEPHNTSKLKPLADLHASARKTIYGQGRARQYSHAWHDEQGWITDRNNEAILRLDKAPDRQAFRRDALEQPEKLLLPKGLNAELGAEYKALAVSGSLTPDLCDEKLVEGILELGLPIFFLPHLAQAPLTGKQLALLPINLKMAARNFPPMTTPHHLPSNSWCAHYEKLLRGRLRELPGGYEFTVLRAVRELEDACRTIAWGAATPETTGNEQLEIFITLHSLTFRGIVIGLASLAYHGFGFDTGCSRAQTMKLLRHLRDKGPLSRRDLQRKVPSLGKELRDNVLERLASEGLVELDNKMVTAVPMDAFVEALHDRPEFPAPEPRVNTEP